MFNNYFANVVKDLSGNKLNLHDDKHTGELFQVKFRFNPVDEKEVEKVIDSLKRKNSTGYDEIPVTLIKDVKKEISKILSHLMNSSFASGIFPQNLKKIQNNPNS
uniref:Reverse transcriptase domain-containing protein n=1 Tax=Graphocephala atropunctata TaxID=36148 RepID=A0A1B6LQL6_9HEMI